MPYRARLARQPSHRARAVASVALFCAACTGAHQRPQQQPARAEDAVEQPDQPRRYISARAYQHVLTALLAREKEDHAAASRELHEALLYDPESAYLRTLYADELLRLGKLSDAERELGNAIERDPAYAPAHLFAAKLALARGRRDEARAELRAAIDASPQEPESYRELVRLEIASGDLRAAAAAADEVGQVAEHASANGRAGQADAWDETFRVSRLRGQASDAWLDVARAMADRDDDAGAQAAFEHASTLRPDTDEALAARAAFLESRRRWAEARELQLRLLAHRPDSPEVLTALARLSLAEGEMEVATAHVHKLRSLAAEIDPGASEDDRRDAAGALFRIAVPLLGAHRPVDAQSALDAALRLFPAHPELSFYRALALEQRGKHREAAQAFEHLQRSLRTAFAGIGFREPTVATAAPAFLAADQSQLLLDARVQAALSHGRAGENAEAARRMKLLFAEQPTDEGVALGLLEVLDRAGHVADAVALLDEAARKHADSPGVLFARASALDRAGRVPEALATMRKVMALAPAHAGALNYVGYTMAERGEDLHEAEGLLRRALQLRPDDGAITDSLGFCLFKAGRTEDALVELRRANQLTPGDPVILGHLGDALLAAGRRDEALRAFRRALARLLPAARVARERHARVDDDEQEPRSPEPGDAKVRAEIEGKLRSLTAP